MNPSSWRGIAKRNALGKLLSLLVAHRLLNCLDYKGFLPEKQHGFIRGRSKLSACSVLFDEIKKSTKGKDTPLYVVFIDYKAAFDSASRSTIMSKLSDAGVGGKIHELISQILRQGDVAL